MVKKVVDANFLKDVVLEEYLSSDSGNFVVFTDLLCMEAYKGNPVRNIQKSLQIVSKYPAQVIVLKPTRVIIRNQSVGMVGDSEFEDADQIKGFKLFCEQVEQAKGDDKRIAFLGREALLHFENMKNDAPKTIEGILKLPSVLSSNHLHSIKKREPLSKESKEERRQLIIRFAMTFFRKHPNVVKQPISEYQLIGSYIFRYALACYQLAMQWISDGGIETVNLNRLRNDTVDMTHVAYSTFFDGFLSNDQKAMKIYQEARCLLDGEFVRSALKYN